MAGQPHRIAAAAAAAAAVLALAGCSQAQPEGATAKQAGDLKIVAQNPVDQNGAEVMQENAGTPADPRGDGNANCVPVAIAIAGPFSGPDSPFGSNVQNGAELAVEQHNATNPGCQVKLRAFDTQGEPDKAAAIAPQIVDDASIIGLIGPTWSGETKATGTIFNQAGLVAITPSATNADLSQRGWTTFFRGLPNDGVQSPALASYIKNTLGVKKACLVDDGTDAGRGQIRVIADTLGPIVVPGCTVSIKKGDKDFSAAVSQIMAKSPDAVVYAAYYTEGALLVDQLREAGFTGLFVGPDGLKDPQFVQAGGQSAKDAVISCPCGPASGAFVDEYTTEFGQAPGTYSVEAYDAATILLKGIDAGAVSRPALLGFVKAYDGQGLARKYHWTDNGELTSNLIWIYRVR